MKEKNHISVDFAVAPTIAAALAFHHLNLAAAMFEAGPLQPELLEAFDKEFPDPEVLGVKSKRQFIESLNAEYVDKFDDEAEENDSQAEGE